MFLVVLGHTPGAGFGLQKFLYLFSIQLFFSASGFLFNPDYSKLKFTNYVKKYAKGLLITYLVFSVVTTPFIWYVEKSLGGETLPRFGITSLVTSTLYGTPAGAPQLWFFSCLFSVFVLAYFIFKTRDKRIRWAAVLIAGATSYYAVRLFRTQTTFFNIDLALMMLPFFMLGHSFRDFTKKRFKNGTKWLGLSAMAGLGLVILSTSSNIVSPYKRYLGSSIFTFYLGGLLGLLMVLGISIWLGKTQVLEDIAKSTIFIYPIYWIGYLFGFYALFGRVVPGNLFQVVLTALSTVYALSLVAKPVMRRFSWVFGGRIIKVRQ